jgi:hypothetical protein
LGELLISKRWFQRSIKLGTSKQSLELVNDVTTPASFVASAILYVHASPATFRPMPATTGPSEEAIGMSAS